MGPKRRWRVWAWRQKQSDRLGMQRPQTARKSVRTTGRQVSFQMSALAWSAFPWEKVGLPAWKRERVFIPALP